MRRRAGDVIVRGLGQWAGHGGPLSAALVLFLLAIVAGCSGNKSRSKAEAPPPRYPTLPPRENVPAFMKGTIWEVAELRNQAPYPVSNYGLVVGLEGSGDNNGTPLAVRNHIIDEMVRHGFGSRTSGLRDLKPEAIIRDPRTAIVEVYGLLPPGARAGQRVDVMLRAVEGSNTRSLAKGQLYQADLFAGGLLDPIHPKGRVNSYMKARGPVFVNPAYVSEQGPESAGKLNLRQGTILNGGLVINDRPINLQIRSPQLSVARAVEMRVDQRFADETVASTQDEAIIYLFVPQSFGGDWDHFIGVVNHLYLDRSQGVAALKARMLADEAQKPNAPLMDISYCWEGLGADVIPFVQPFYTHARPEVAFAAARAGAFVGDAAAEEALLEMARTDGHAFQLNAVKSLGGLAGSPRIDRMMQKLLSAGNALVRIEAYRLLAEHESPAVISHTVGDAYILDRIVCDGPPLVYASRSGVPRIAVFGREVPLSTPIMFRAMGDRLTISTRPDNKSISLFDRTSDATGGMSLVLRPDLHELIYRLGGGGASGPQAAPHFGYSEVVGVLQALAQQKHFAGTFVLQDSPGLQDAIEDAPPILEPTGRPAAEAAAPAPGGVPTLSNR